MMILLSEMLRMWKSMDADEEAVDDVATMAMLLMMILLLLVQVIMYLDGA